jgi:hypothetical protein
MEALHRLSLLLRRRAQAIVMTMEFSAELRSREDFRLFERPP